MTTDPEDLLRGLSAVVSANQQLARTIGAAHGLHDTAFRALVFIAAQGTTTPKRISEDLTLTSGTVTPIIDRLERDGFLVRTLNEADRRGSILSLTARGSHVATRVREAYEQAMTSALDHLPPEQATAYLRALATALATSAESYGL